MAASLNHLSLHVCIALSFSLIQLYIPGILAFGAAIIGTAGNLYCETVQLTQEETTREDGGDPLVIYAGMWTFRTNEMTSDPLSSSSSSSASVCHTYQSLLEAGFDYDTDAKTRFVMAFAIITPIIGGLALFLACAGPCCCNVTTSRWRAMGGIFLLSGLFQGFTLVVMQSSICNDNPVIQYYEEYDLVLWNSFGSGGGGECKGYTGYHLSIAAVALWLLAGTAALVLPSPHVDGRQPEQCQTVIYQRDEHGHVIESSVVIVKGTDPTPPTEQAKPRSIPNIGAFS